MVNGVLVRGGDDDDEVMDQSGEESRVEVECRQFETLELINLEVAAFVVAASFFVALGRFTLVLVHGTGGWAGFRHSFMAVGGLDEEGGIFQLLAAVMLVEYQSCRADVDE